MNIPGPSCSPTASKNIQLSYVAPSDSKFGFPETEVINFINSYGLSSDDARDFMLFLTFSSQISQCTNGNCVNLRRAAAVITLVNQLSDGADTGLEKSPILSKATHSRPTPSPVKITKSSVRNTLKSVKPTLAKHNDVKFYPNIICVICKEWFCSRSRRIHIGAHFGYRKYKCSTCGFSHTKEIFVETHIRKCHNRIGIVLQKDDPVIECRIEEACNDSIAMTRDVLSGRCDEESYANYAKMSTDRSQIANKERRSRTQVLCVVSDSSNRHSH